MFSIIFYRLATFRPYNSGVFVRQIVKFWNGILETLKTAELSQTKFDLGSFFTFGDKQQKNGLFDQTSLVGFAQLS